MYIYKYVNKNFLKNFERNAKLKVPFFTLFQVKTFQSYVKYSVMYINV